MKDANCSNFDLPHPVHPAPSQKSKVSERQEDHSALCFVYSRLFQSGVLSYFRTLPLRFYVDGALVFDVQRRSRL